MGLGRGLAYHLVAGRRHFKREGESARLKGPLIFQEAYGLVAAAGGQLGSASHEQYGFRFHGGQRIAPPPPFVVGPQLLPVEPLTTLVNGVFFSRP